MLELDEQTPQLIERCCALIEPANLHLICIMEPIAYAHGGEISVDLTEIQKQRQDQSTEQLHSIALQHGVPVSQVQTTFGRLEACANKYAAETNCPLIVLGSETKVSLNALTRDIACDVLIISCKEPVGNKEAAEIV